MSRKLYTKIKRGCFFQNVKRGCLFTHMYSEAGKQFEKYRPPEDAALRGGLVVEAHRRVYHSTLGSRVVKKKKKRYNNKREEEGPPEDAAVGLRVMKEKSRLERNKREEAGQ